MEILILNPAKPPTATPCLAIHGLGGGPWELEPLVESLRAQGFAPRLVTLPGHETPGPIMPPSRWQDWYDTVEAAFLELHAAHGPVPVIGFSTGGTLALRLANQHPVAKLALLAPFIAIRHTWRIPIPACRYVGLLCKFVPNLPRRDPPVRDPAMRAWAKKVERYRTFSMRATQSALELIDLVKPTVPTITTPTLVLQGRRDSVVEPLGARWLTHNLGSAIKRLTILDRSDHLLALDYDRKQVADEVTQFLNTNESSAPERPSSAPTSSHRPPPPA